ncbi:MAG: DUF2459 domain-containing protein [Blastocatellia bacterium]|nr:DUF2459 domain-containing protein [Blastocatellia bacterium]
MRDLRSSVSTLAKRAGRFSVVVATALALAVGCPALFMWLATPPAPAIDLPAEAPSTRHRVFVMAWGYHSSIFVEQPAGWRLGPEGHEDAPVVEYGWGDRSFFMESNYCPISLFNAAFIPTPTVVYVRGHDRPPNEFVAGGEIYVRECSAEELRLLVTILESQMARAADGARPRPFPPTAEYGGRFYPGREYYVIWWNCNEWTVRMLRDAGMASSAACVGLKDQVGGRLVGFAPARRTVE